MSIQVRYLNYGEYSRAASFLNSYWAQNHAYVKMPQLFDWTFGYHSNWDHDTYSFAIAERGSEVIGILGGIPFLLNVYGQTAHGVWLVNWIVHPSERDGRCALALLKQFTRPPFDATIAFGINVEAFPVYRALRWKVVEDIPRYFFILPEAVDRMMHMLMLTYPEWEALRARTLAEAVTLTRLQDIPETVGQFSPPDWEQWDLSIWPQMAKKTIGAVRDSAYLKWRYLEHPIFKYRFVIVPEGEKIGLAVWRSEVIRQATPEGLREIDTLGRVVEFMPASRRNCEVLLSLLLLDMRRNGTMGADFYCYHGEIGAWLEQLGVIAVDKIQSGSFIPSRFQPLDVEKGRHIRSALYGQLDSPDYPLSPNCHWYWTKSDADQDRPN
jgi:hypothetical protein